MTYESAVWLRKNETWSRHLNWIRLISSLQSQVAGWPCFTRLLWPPPNINGRERERESVRTKLPTLPGVYHQITWLHKSLHMALFKQGSQDQECPVCYENLSGNERTLSCGHVFCHDCLVKTLVSINSDGNIRDTIACPICRHLTFIRRQKEELASLEAKQSPDERQTLEVPVPPPRPGLRQSARRASVDSLLFGVNWVIHCCRCACQRIRAGRLIGPGHNNTCQIFIISAQGRPMAEEDELEDVVTSVVPQPRRRRRRICTTARCLVFLLSAFTLLALVAATLPWILLAWSIWEAQSAKQLKKTFLWIITLHYMWMTDPNNLRTENVL